jgi:crotonobetainyl-CoA:carnitine CoA-transferase CaiB-like acyl-CoA transferase
MPPLRADFMVRWRPERHGQVRSDRCLLAALARRAVASRRDYCRSKRGYAVAGQAFDDVVVLDLTQHIAGPYATRLLADFGADVIKVERPGGDPTRRLGPFKDDDESPEKSGLFFYLNCNKRSVVLDLRGEQGRAALAKLAARAHVVVESYRPGVLERLGCGWNFFKAINPALSLVSISNFGQNGPYRDYKVSELVLYGYAGEMYSMGLNEREPVKMAGTAALFESGSSVAVAVIGALFASRRFGIGEHVDVSLAETHAGGVDRRHAAAIAFQYSGRKNVRDAGGVGGMPQGIYNCADGYVDFNNAGIHVDRIKEMLRGEEWAQDPHYDDPLARLNPEVVEEWNSHFLVWCIQRTKREIWAEARRAKVMCGPLFTMQDLYEDEHFRSRGFWERAIHPVLGEVDMPGRPFIMKQGGWKLRRPAPLLGEHTTEVLREAGLSETEIAAAAGEVVRR